jgi:hypothetical protein
MSYKIDNQENIEKIDYEVLCVSSCDICFDEKTNIMKTECGCKTLYCLNCIESMNNLCCVCKNILFNKQISELNEIFDPDDYLPHNKQHDWYEDIPEVIDVKNRHLINIYKQIDMNTIGTRFNQSIDIREAVCPKFAVSPWLQSTSEPDTNVKHIF